jgi:hypothetical protein
MPIVFIIPVMPVTIPVMPVTVMMAVVRVIVAIPVIGVIAVSVIRIAMA